MSTRSSARRRRGSHPMVGRTDVRKPTFTSSTPIWQRTNARPEDVINFWCTELDKPLFVYFIEDDGGPVKVGKAYDPIARLSELQCGNPRPLSLKHVILAGPSTEQTIHQTWWFARGFGEWFGDGHQASILNRAKEAQQRQIKAARTASMREIIDLAIDSLTPEAR